METSHRPCSGKSSSLAFGAMGKGEARTAPLKGTEADTAASIVENSGAGIIANAQSDEPPYTDPYVRWCGRGGAAKLPPIPIGVPSMNDSLEVEVLYPA
jgi:hypothetical protein